MGIYKLKWAFTSLVSRKLQQNTFASGIEKRNINISAAQSTLQGLLTTKISQEDSSSECRYQHSNFVISAIFIFIKMDIVLDFAFLYIRDR